MILNTFHGFVCEILNHTCGSDWLFHFYACAIFIGHAQKEEGNIDDLLSSVAIGNSFWRVFYLQPEGINSGDIDTYIFNILNNQSSTKLKKEDNIDDPLSSVAIGNHKEKSDQLQVLVRHLWSNVDHVTNQANQNRLASRLFQITRKCYCFYGYLFLFIFNYFSD